VVPYLGCARGDRGALSARIPISAKVVANMIEAVGADRVLTIDVHADQIQGFFNVPVDNIYAASLLLGDIARRAPGAVTVVSPDIGGVVRARALAQRLSEARLAIIDQRRPQAHAAPVLHVIGDVEARCCVIIDDMVETAGTLCQAAAVVKAHGAAAVYGYATHALLTAAAVTRIEASLLDELVVTDTLLLAPSAADCPRIRQLSVAPLLAETLRRIHGGESVSSLCAD
jgi:ribose-phosphate pyrophosphokinase